VPPPSPVLFSVLLISCISLLQLSVPKDRLEVGEWLKTSSTTISIALNLVPVAGAAFLWFLGVLRDRLGDMEDKFFASVFLGSGLIFVGMTFIAVQLVEAFSGPTLSRRAFLETHPPFSLPGF
jgi:hypothetical protein